MNICKKINFKGSHGMSPGIDLLINIDKNKKSQPFEL